MLDAIPLALAASLIPGTFLAHAAYYRIGSKRSTKQEISIRDESLDTRPVLSIEGPAAGRSRPTAHVITIHRERIVEGDLQLADRHMAMAAIKITGDLTVEGNATFAGPVVVDGHVKIRGEASFHGGLLVKGDLLVVGRARFGTDARGSWCIAGRTVGNVIHAPIEESLQQELRTA